MLRTPRGALTLNPAKPEFQEGEDGTDAILRAARDELRVLARLAISSDDGESL
jgi:hypothetical protein